MYAATGLEYNNLNKEGRPYPVFKPGDKVRMVPSRLEGWGRDTLKKWGSPDKLHVVTLVDNYSPHENRYVYLEWHPDQAHGPEHFMLVRKPTILVVSKKREEIKYGESLRDQEG